MPGQDVVVVGAGLGGLACAARLARAGRKVLVLEKNPHIGGTSYVFTRGPFTFPMGPLSFSFPGKVRAFLEGVGAGGDLTFTRNHFQLVSPYLDIVYSHPLGSLRLELETLFPGEAAGLDGFFAELTAGPEPDPGLSARDVLDRHIRDLRLRNFLGSQGTSPPEMSMRNLRLMWHLMSEEGIWSPSGGIHGICRRLERTILEAGGEVRLAEPVEEIVVEGGRAVGVLTLSGRRLKAGWVVSNADQKRTFLDLIPPDRVPPGHLAAVRHVPYTGSEICVFLGLDPGRMDFGRMRATHLFFRRVERPGPPRGEDAFEDREVEICRWSDNFAGAAPPGKAVLLLRVNTPYDAFASWRTGEKERKAGYREHKNRLADKLIETVSSILPGLSKAIEAREVATPLTYRDWGQRTLGSIAGWTWSPEAAGWPEPLLVRTPVDRLLSVGVYAARELFLGGVPTAFHTAEAAAGIILAES